ncbi:MIT domain-containing protein 1-like [Chrysoperla carnea]|uniref:MIT domain-containing protein 1-like n=1 Tax=Chrysoperla carnea TaxID=189513 RepID=UPI001D0781DD|nr:MIT domain-containing protein 1-like [Chrysoperla carnea]XP_044742639.1 MIT domain-containing protein 1-like [Chrysoperla carnea]XP_044742640.1 MIT domain-containing protein 1-like [Chrysoperla carnea]XP_044742641.1 MIT domain-containing protein 1-like [Chrysoperla carnea]XP_044742642.1 MIT domain-containing protein 1-like [Chrysoperla carnea]
MSLDSAAAKILQRAVALENEQKFTESLVCFQEGIELLMNSLKAEKSAEKKNYLREKIDGYMTHAEKIKQHVQHLKDIGKFHEQIKIENNSTSHSYEKVFGRFLEDAIITHIKIEDPYIRNFHQCQNLLRFCELAVKKCSNLKKIILLTTEDPDNTREQVEWFHLIGKGLHKYNIVFHHTFSESLHDRQITLSTGWIIKIGRGLDYFKAPENKFTLGVFDMDFRPCHETNVDIFHSKDVKISS